MWWFSRWITLPLGALGGLAVFILMVLAVIDIGMRLASGRGVRGVIEYSEVILVVGVFFAIAAAHVKGVHVRTTGLVSRLSPNGRRIVELIGGLLSVLVLGTMAYVAVTATLNSISIGEYRMGIAQVAMWPARAAVAIGFILYLIEYIHSTVQMLRNPVFEDDEAHELELAEKGVLL